MYPLNFKPQSEREAQGWVDCHRNKKIRRKAWPKNEYISVNSYIGKNSFKGRSENGRIYKLFIESCGSDWELFTEQKQPLSTEEDWFNQVKGKKIAWSGNPDFWIIPNRIIDLRKNTVWGLEFEYVDKEGDMGTDFFYNGFLPLDNGVGHWVWYNETGTTTTDFPKENGTRHKCHCDLTSLLRGGCKCGGI